MSLESIKPGWNEIARQHGDKMRWRETGRMTISEARRLYDAGLIEMATSRIRLPRQRNRRRCVTAELALMIWRREEAAKRSPYFGRQLEAAQ